MAKEASALTRPVLAPPGEPRAADARPVALRATLAAALALASIHLDDLVMMSLVVAWGPFVAIVLTWALVTVWASLFWLLIRPGFAAMGTPTVLRRAEERMMARLRPLLRRGAPLALLVLAANSGPLAVSFTLHLLGYQRTRTYPLVLLSAAAYALVWAGLIYGGGWWLLSQPLQHWGWLPAS